MNEEIWKPLKDFETSYEVSNNGKIRTLTRKVECHNGKIITIPGKELKCSESKGYKKVMLHKNHEIVRQTTLHRLIAETFLANKKECVNHIDGNKQNNDISNLEWVSYSENNKHACRTGLKPPQKGEKGSNAKFSNKEVEEIRNRCFYDRDRYEDIAKEFDMTPQAISDIATGKYYKEAGGPRIFKQTRYSNRLKTHDGKLTLDQKEEIQQKSNNSKITELAKEYNVGNSTISKIIEGKYYGNKKI